MRMTVVALFLCTVALHGQTPQSRLTYEDRSDDAGHVLVVGGKTFGPYREVLAASFSTSASAIAFAVTKRDRVWVLAQGRESGPLPPGFEFDRLQISDDGRVWILMATRPAAKDSDPDEILLMVNGKTFGPYSELTTVEFAETGGLWIAAVRTAPEEADVLLSGKPQGPFFAVDHAWVSPDGKDWGYAVSDSDGRGTVVTATKTWTDVVEGNFTSLYPREPHWGYSLDLGAQGQRIVVDGQVYEGLRGFRGLVLTPSGKHWGFEAQRVTDGALEPVVVVDGKTYPGDTLVWSRLGGQELFAWSVHDQSKVIIRVMKLP